MARQLRKPHEQLTFPGLELPPEVTAPLAAPSETLPLAALTAEASEPAAPKPARKRSPRPKMVLVKEGASDFVPETVSANEAADPGTPQIAPPPEGDAVPVPSQAALSAPIPEPEKQTPLAMPATAPEAVACPPLAPLPEPTSQAAVAAPIIEKQPAMPPETFTPAAPQAPLRRIPEVAPAPLKGWANAATIAAALALVAALLVGSSQFIETQQHQRQLLAAQQAAVQQEGDSKAAEINVKAVELLLRYNDLMLQVNAPAAKNARKESRYWKENLAINLLESLYNLTRGKKEWENTIGWALERHGRFIRDQRLNCAGYSSEFVRYLEKTLATKAPALCKDAGLEVAGQ